MSPSLVAALLVFAVVLAWAVCAVAEHVYLRRTAGRFDRAVDDALHLTKEQP